jgi:1-deoxy-D-xylulose-5-phosphate synthase
VGAMVAPCVEVAEKLAAQGIGVTLVDPRWVKPVDEALVDLAAAHRLVVSVEDNGRVGGCGATLAQVLTDADVQTPVRVHGVPQEFLQHAKRAAILDRIGLNPADLLHSVVDDLARVDDGRRLREVPARRGSETA